jgi:hypothetical protein
MVISLPQVELRLTNFPLHTVVNDSGVYLPVSFTSYRFDRLLILVAVPTREERTLAPTIEPFQGIEQYTQ